MTAPQRYAVVTPARDDAQNLRLLGESLIAQTLPPSAWVVVDNGSTDETVVVAERFAREYAWVRVTTAPGEAEAVPGAPIVRAFHAGVDRLELSVDVVVKVDADVTMAPEYFERLLDAFAADPRLGIAGGVCYELAGGEWSPTIVTGNHVRGAVRAYRRDCLDELLPLPERTGWDTIDELQAEVLGWTVRTLPSLRFDHHRALGARDGGRGRRWRAQGSAAHYLGYSPLYLLLRALFHAARDPAALGLLAGFVGAAVRRKPRHPDTRARALLRRRQSVRRLGARLRDRRSSVPSS